MGTNDLPFGVGTNPMRLYLFLRRNRFLVKSVWVKLALDPAQSEPPYPSETLAITEGAAAQESQKKSVN